jgi:hypothetical protein
MANDRKRTDEEYSGPDRDRVSETADERVGSPGDDVRGIAEDEEDFEDTDDLDDDDEDGDGSF